MWLSESSLQRPLPWKPFQPSLLPLLHQFPIWEIQEWVPVFSWGSCSFFSQAQRAPHGVSEQGTILPHHSPWGGKQHLHYCHQSQGESSWHIIRKARTAFVLSYSPRFVLFSVCVLCKKKKMTIVTSFPSGILFFPSSQITPEFFACQQGNPSQISVPPLETVPLMTNTLLTPCTPGWCI